MQQYAKKLKWCGEHGDHTIILMTAVLVIRKRFYWSSEGRDRCGSTILPKDKLDLRNKMLQL